MGSPSPRAQIKHELDRAMNNLTMMQHHIMRAAWWAEQGKRPEVSAYLEEMAKGGLMLTDAMKKFEREVLGYQ